MKWGERKIIFLFCVISCTDISAQMKTDLLVSVLKESWKMENSSSSEIHSHDFLSSRHASSSLRHRFTHEMRMYTQREYFPHRGFPHFPRVKKWFEISSPNFLVTAKKEISPSLNFFSTAQRCFFFLPLFFGWRVVKCVFFLPPSLFCLIRGIHSVRVCIFSACDNRSGVLRTVATIRKDSS